MTRSEGARRSTVRLFTIYAIVSLVPVLVLGVVLALTFRSQAMSRGLAQGRSEAILVAQTAVEPQLMGRPLTGGLSATEKRRLGRLVSDAVGDGHILRLRLRDLVGNVVFSDDGSGFGGPPEDEAVAASHGHVVTRLTRLNSDANDTGKSGVSAVEVYQPLSAGSPAHRIGVLELYLPYAPIRRDVTASLHSLYLDLGVGLAVLYVVLLVITVTATRGLRRQLVVNAFLAEHDALTELPNRTLFRNRAEQEVRHGGPAAIAIIDLDRFKQVNDTLGHRNGDRLLKELAKRLSEVMRPGDTVARLGGDEFGLVLSNIDDPEQLLQRLRGVTEHPIELSGLPLSIEGSIGFALAPEDGTDVELLLARADLAMYGAKERHTGVMRYEESLDRYDAASLSLVSELRGAIEDGQLVLHYQPQRTLHERRVQAVEALVRWQHPTRGLLQPDDFLPLAEQTHVMDELTAWVLRTALSEIREIDPGGELRVAVNVSTRCIGQLSFADEVIATLEALDVPANRLIIEVTETALLYDPPRAATVLTRLSQAGVAISLDDFGRGQTSLAYLSNLPIYELKIDKTFVTDMVENQAHAAIVRSIIELGHNLTLRVVGEGVERTETLESLSESECDVAQGFLLAHPMPGERLREWLDRAHALPV